MTDTVQPAALPDALREQIADELVRARAGLERIGEALCSDPAITQHHMVSLQAFDRIGQHLLALASVLQAHDPARAVGEMPLESLRLRLERTLR